MIRQVVEIALLLALACGAIHATDHAVGGYSCEPPSCVAGRDCGGSPMEPQPAIMQVATQPGAGR